MGNRECIIIVEVDDLLYKDYRDYEEFLAEYKVYEFDKCTKCDGTRELVETELYYTIGDRSLHFPSILVK